MTAYQQIYALGSPRLINKPTELFCEVWKQEKIPKKLKDVSIIHMHKKEWNSKSCGNHRSISLSCTYQDKSWP